MTVNLPFKLTIQTNQDTKTAITCAICGFRFHTPICGVISGVPSGDHGVCDGCILKTQAEMLVGAIEFKDYLELLSFTQGQLIEHLRHCEFEHMPTKAEIDQFTFESQVGELEDE